MRRCWGGWSNTFGSAECWVLGAGSQDPALLSTQHTAPRGDYGRVVPAGDEVDPLGVPPPSPGPSARRATVDVIPTASAYFRYVSMEAITTRASTVIRSMPTREMRTHASTTMPLSRIRSSTSMRLVPPGARSTAMVYLPFLSPGFPVGRLRSSSFVSSSVIRAFRASYSSPYATARGSLE